MVWSLASPGACAEVGSMTNSSGARCDLSESLFEDEDEKTITRPKRVQSKPATDDVSDEFKKLVVDTSKKIARRKVKPRTIAASMFDRSLVEVDEMIKTGEWDAAGARHLVALYDRLHARCYKVEAAELGPAERYNAAMMAANMVRREFGGEYPEAVEFMRWAWEREISAEKWRRENSRVNARRLGVRLMFGGALLTDYRLYLARKSHNT